MQHAPVHHLAAPKQNSVVPNTAPLRNASPVLNDMHLMSSFGKHLQTNAAPQHKPDRFKSCDFHQPPPSFNIVPVYKV